MVTGRLVGHASVHVRRHRDRSPAQPRARQPRLLHRRPRASFTGRACRFYRARAGRRRRAPAADLRLDERSAPRVCGEGSRRRLVLWVRLAAKWLRCGCRRARRTSTAAGWGAATPPARPVRRWPRRSHCGFLQRNRLSGPGSRANRRGAARKGRSDLWTGRLGAVRGKPSCRTVDIRHQGRTELHWRFPQRPTRPRRRRPGRAGRSAASLPSRSWSASQPPRAVSIPVSRHPPTAGSRGARGDGVGHLGIPLEDPQTVESSIQRRRRRDLQVREVLAAGPRRGVRPRRIPRAPDRSFVEERIVLLVEHKLDPDGDSQAKTRWALEFFTAGDQPPHAEE